MDVMAREYGNLDGVTVPLAACYYKLGKVRKEQDDPDSAIVFFKKALKLNPDYPDSIFEIVLAFLDKDSPAEGRKYLTEYAENFIKRVGRESYDSLLSICMPPKLNRLRTGVI